MCRAQLYICTLYNRVCNAVSVSVHSSELGPPHPLTPPECVLPPGTEGGGGEPKEDTHACG
jgi:hypothetical protein